MGFCRCRILLLICGHVICLASVPAAFSRVERSAGNGAGAFAETEDGQSTVITEHGAVTTEHTQGVERKQEKGEELYSPDDWAIIREELEEVGIHRLSRRDVSRKKRFMSKNYFWPKGIVPYDFNTEEISEYYRKEALAAMTRWHKYTCIRFVPWIPQVTMEKYGLPAESHVTITKGSGCAAHQGNIRRKKGGQYNSCCSRGTCTHELGHTLGLWHEHQSPASKGVMELIEHRVPSGMMWTYKVKTGSNLIVYQYDSANTMHYGGSAFRILYEDLQPVHKMSNQYYMYKDVSLYHDCRGLHCSNFTDECYNGAFVTLVNDVCSCLCPAGLDPSTGCATTVKQITTSPVWPSGAFALFSGVDGCPSTGNFQTGSWEHAGKGGNSKSSEFNLGGTFTSKRNRYEFCVNPDPGTTDEPDAPSWEPGRYCILRANNECPEGFEEGYIQFDDDPDMPGNKSGQLPDGSFSNDTRMQFCCRNDGFTSTPLINIPNTQPLVLVMSQSRTCQEIAGMRWTEEYIYVRSYPTEASKGGNHPYVSKNTLFRIYYCHYVPVDLNCGGEITLTRSNRQVSIQSPNYPSAYGTNMECNWLIKAEDDGQVMLNFDEMKITSSGSSCKDSLEIRYNLPGQPGLRYCGDGISRTIRSLGDTIILTLRSDHKQVAADIGFNVTASLFLPEEESCYDPETKGALYRGRKNFTRSMKACMDWTQVTECPQHALQLESFAKGLDKNYCRNPDGSDMPWCYTTSSCDRDYCDVCNNENIYDKSARCTSQQCAQLTPEQKVTDGCAATCNVQPAAAPNRDVTCGEPSDIVDAERVTDDGESSSTYNLGDTVTYRCKVGNETLQRKCLGNGQWSEAGFVCGVCSPKWTSYNGACYRWFPQQLTFAAAREACASYGALVTPQENEAELNFTSRLRGRSTKMWIGATDIAKEGTFVWEDGTPLNFTNWHPRNTPNNYRNQDCVSIYKEVESIWNDVFCHYKYTYMCKYLLAERQGCVDFRSDCQSLLREVPDLCSTHTNFADEMCPFSCGLCEPDSTPACNVDFNGVVLVEPSEANVTSVSRGTMVRFVCPEGQQLTSGDLHMACGQDGQLTGEPPVCEDPNTIVQESNKVRLIDRAHLTSPKYSYTGQGPNLAITRTGVIKQWQFYSRTPGFTFFQVWRPDLASNNKSFYLIGNNQIMTLGQGVETQDVQEADWIHVQPGDNIGILELINPRGSVPFNRCNGRNNPDSNGVKNSRYRKTCGDFSPFKAIGFNPRISCVEFSFRAVIYPNDSVAAVTAVPTSQVPLVERNRLGSAKYIYIADSDNTRVPVDGVISEWQMFVRKDGVGRLQVWRRSNNTGTRTYEFVGENEVNVTENKPQLFKMTVPEGERIAVKAGDIIGIDYTGRPARLDIPYLICSASNHPEADNVYWLRSRTLTKGDVHGFGFSRGWRCRQFSFRAIVIPN